MPAQAVDARHVALETLRRFISLLDFSRSGPKGRPSTAFRVQYKDIHTEQPDNVVDMAMPAIAVVANDGTRDSYGLGAGQIDEATVDLPGPGLVLYNIGEWNEELNIEVWGSSRPERRSLVEGMTEALTICEETSTLRLKLPDYWNQVAKFEHLSTRYVEDTSIDNRRRASMRVALSVPMMRVARYRKMIPQVKVEVVEASTCDAGASEP